MELKKITGVALEEIAKYFAWYFPSLQKFPDKYLPLIFSDPANPPEHHAYLCPLCLENGIVVGQKTGLKLSSKFSLDHFPPESVGGYNSILVCKPCNNNMGGAFDYIIKDQMNRMSFENRINLSGLKATITISGVKGNYKGPFTINNNGELIIGFNAEGDKDAVFLNQWLQNPGEDWEAKVTIQHPDETKLAKALIKAAYLFCFGTWGYEFAFSRSAEMIRKFLAGECEYPSKVPFAWFGSEIRGKQIDLFPIGVCYLQKPMECKTFIVNMVLVNTETGFREVASVPIPNPTETGWTDLGLLNNEFQKMYANNTEVSILHANQFLLRDGFFNGYTKSWEYLSQLGQDER